MGNPFYTGLRKECNLLSGGAAVMWQSGERAEALGGFRGSGGAQSRFHPLTQMMVKRYSKSPTYE